MDMTRASQITAASLARSIPPSVSRRPSTRLARHCGGNLHRSCKGGLALQDCLAHFHVARLSRVLGRCQRFSGESVPPSSGLR